MTPFDDLSRCKAAAGYVIRFWLHVLWGIGYEARFIDGDWCFAQEHP